MPSESDLERQLRAFGDTLAERTPVTITPPAPTAAGVRRWSRPWTVVTAAACLAALVAGLVALGARSPEDRADVARATTPRPSSPPVATTVTSTAPVSEPEPEPEPTVPPTAPRLAGVIGDDPLGLLASGWTRSSRVEEPFADAYEGCADPASAAVAGIETVREFLSDPTGGTTVVATYLPASAGADIRAATAALGGCPSLVGSDVVTSLDDPEAGVSGFRTDTFAFVAVSADGVDDIEYRPVAVVLSVLPATDAALVADLVERARGVVGLTATPVAAPPAPPTTAPAGAPAPGPSLTVEWLPPAEPLPDVGADEEVLVLMVSNQSFDDDPIGLTIEVDGLEVVDDRFEVRDQHTVTTYRITGLAPGSHDLVAVAETGVARRTTIRTNAGAPRWVYVTYWHDLDDPEGRFVDVTESDERPALD